MIQIIIIMIKIIIKIKVLAKVVVEKQKEKVKEETKTIQNTSCQVLENQPQRFGKVSPFIGVQSASVGVPIQLRSTVVISALTTLQQTIPPVPRQPTLIRLSLLLLKKRLSPLQAVFVVSEVLALYPLLHGWM